MHMNKGEVIFRKGVKRMRSLKQGKNEEAETSLGKI